MKPALQVVCLCALLALAAAVAPLKGDDKRHRFSSASACTTCSSSQDCSFGCVARPTAS
jgi:hypothetical protein